MDFSFFSLFSVAAGFSLRFASVSGIWRKLKLAAAFCHAARLARPTALFYVAGSARPTIHPHPFFNFEP
jgi:hypothetical protein